MEKIHLSKIEKQVFLRISDKEAGCPRSISATSYCYAVAVLVEKGLIEAAFNGPDEVLDASLSVKGKAYLEQNPGLNNPVDWKWIVSTILLALTATATILALFIPH